VVEVVEVEVVVLILVGWPELSRSGFYSGAGASEGDFVVRHVPNLAYVNLCALPPAANL
jgi:hypothetical protein